MVDNIEHFAERLHRSGRIDRHARLHAQAANQLQGAIQVNAGFLMDRNPVRAGIGESRDELVGIFDHQMAVEGNIDGLAKARDNRRPNRNIGHKVAVHHIDMEEGGATSHRGIGIFSQAGEIGRQNGRRYLDQDKASLASISRAILTRLPERPYRA